MKTFHYEYPWTSTEEWMLPSEEEMMQNQFPIMDEQIDEVLKHVKQRRICIQAGGAFGMYPLRLAYHFHRVHTFEPVIDNLHCLARNIEDHKDNIEVRHAALWKEEAYMDVGYAKPVKNSYGAHFVQPSLEGAIAAVTVDSFEFQHVDLLWLDVEGAELRALEGARATIDMWRPTVVIEERPLRQMAKLKVRSGQARQWLTTTFGYRVVGRTHGDLIMRS